MKLCVLRPALPILMVALSLGAGTAASSCASAKPIVRSINAVVAQECSGVNSGAIVLPDASFEGGAQIVCLADSVLAPIIARIAAARAKAAMDRMEAVSASTNPTPPSPPPSSLPLPTPSSGKK